MATKSKELNFEDKLWKAADALRGSMDASEYRNVVLGLIFLKYVSDAFEEKHDELLKSDYPEDAEGKDVYVGDNIFWVPKEARWENIEKAAKTPQFGEVIDKAMHGHNLIQAIARVNRVFKDKDSGLIVDYIGIADQLKSALSFYSKTDQNQVGIDVNKALNLLREKFEIIKNDFLFGIDYSEFDSNNSAERIQTVTKVANEILAEDKEIQQKFLDTVLEAQKAFALVSTFDEAQKMATEIAFFVTVKAFINKLGSVSGGSKQTNDSKIVKYRIRQYLDQSIISEPYVDIYKDMGLEKPNLDVISDEFLKKIQKMPEQNIAIIVLQKLLEGKIKSYQRKNLVQGKKFNDMLKDAIEKYNVRGITSEIVIRELIEMAKKMNAEQEKGKNLGLSDEEIAFYDALANHEKAVQVLGEEKLHMIATELVKIVKKESGVDWQRRRNVQAKMRVAVKHLLRKYGYPPDIAPKAVDTVVSQAERLASNEFED